MNKKPTAAQAIALYKKHQRDMHVARVYIKALADKGSIEAQMFIKNISPADMVESRYYVKTLVLKRHPWQTIRRKPRR